MLQSTADFDPAAQKPSKTRTPPWNQSSSVTTISKEIGTGITMLERHYTGVIANWDGRQIPAVEQISTVRRK